MVAYAQRKSHLYKDMHSHDGSHASVRMNVKLPVERQTAEHIYPTFVCTKTKLSTTRVFHKLARSSSVTLLTTVVRKVSFDEFVPSLFAVPRCPSSTNVVWPCGHLAGDEIHPGIGRNEKITDS